MQTYKEKVYNKDFLINYVGYFVCLLGGKDLVTRGELESFTLVLILHLTTYSRLFNF